MTLEMIAETPPWAAICEKSGTPFASRAIGAVKGADAIPATMPTMNASTIQAAARGSVPAYTSPGAPGTE